MKSERFVLDWQYRSLSVFGTLLLTTVSLYVADLTAPELSSVIPVLASPGVSPLSSGSLIRVAIPTALIVMVALLPLYKPQQQSATVQAQKGVLIAAIAIATFGYFAPGYALPRLTLVLMVLLLFVLVSLWQRLIRQTRSPAGTTLIVGDDPESIQEMLELARQPVVGYVSLRQPYFENTPFESAASTLTDGSGVSIVPNPHGLEHLGGVSQLNDILVSYDVDTVVLVHTESDREAFLSVLHSCYENGVRMRVHRELGESVLSSDPSGFAPLAEIDLEPWDPQDRLLKRLFDIGVASVGLVVFTPLLAVIAIAIRRENPGSIVQTHQRTAPFGGTYTEYTFRTKNPSEPEAWAIGRLIRKTRFDELPRLYSLLIGEMSVVGPQATWTDLQHRLGERWAVKPGLTGLSTINGISSGQPEQQKSYDLEYIRTQSFMTDITIVIRHLYGTIEFRQGSEN